VRNRAPTWTSRRLPTSRIVGWHDPPIHIHHARSRSDEHADEEQPRRSPEPAVEPLTTEKPNKHWRHEFEPETDEPEGRRSVDAPLIAVDVVQILRTERLTLAEWFKIIIEWPG
jgi:hypothetical protein